MTVILLRFGELYLKGNNRDVFENTLIRNIKDMLKDEHYQFSKTFADMLSLTLMKIAKMKLLKS